MAHSDLPGLVSSMQPKIGELTKVALAFVAGIGISLIQFLAAFIIAGIIMAFGEAGARACRAIFNRIVGIERGAKATGRALSKAAQKIGITKDSDS